MSLERIIVFVALALPAFVVVGYALFDAITAKHLSVAKKVLWVVVITLAVHIGALLYFLLRPLPDARKASQRGGSERSAAFLDLLERHERGEVGDYAARKRALFTTPGTNHSEVADS